MEEEDEGHKIMAELQVSYMETHTWAQIWRRDGEFDFCTAGGWLLVASSCGGWLLQRPFPFICSSCKEREKATQNSLFLFKVLVPTSLSLVSALQVFQKCTIKEVGGKNLVEPTPRIEPQIKELRPGALLPLKEKKVKYSPSHSCPTNYFPFTISYSLIPTTPVLLLWLKKTL